MMISRECPYCKTVITAENNELTKEVLLRHRDEGCVSVLREDAWKEAVKKDLKHDHGKPEMEYLSQFSLALGEVARVFSFGAKKYERESWTKVEDGQRRYQSALLRHALKTEELDEESGLLHKAHAAWNALAVLELELKKGEQK